MILGYGVFLSSVILILFLPINEFNAFLVAVFYGTYFGIIATVQRALIPCYVDRNLRGTAYGIYYLIVGSAFFVSNAVVGSLWEYFGSSLASAYSIITSIIAITFMILFLKRKR
jgi:MFS-type transporter involved in bile tolerance (Atg22 family)